VGFAHGFSVISDIAIFHYKCTQPYSKEHERSLYYADRDLKINWKNPNPILSEKDLTAPKFADIGNNAF
jgi:dTDP-4-dehydrorhamnose 3,5-epimerase